MADITVRTQTLDRDELQKFIPVGNFRLIKAFENLMEDVAVTIPDAIGTTVTGPTTTGDGDLALFDGTNGQKIKDSGVNITQVALLDSPLFTGNPRAPTPTIGDNDTSIATTAFVSSAVSGFGNVIGPASSTNNNISTFNGATGKVLKDSGVQIGALAALASPALTGTPTAPTAAPGTNTTQLATTAFVATSFAPLASPALTGTPTVPTAAPGTNTTQAASTAFVRAIFAAPPALGSTTPAAVSATTITASSTITPDQTSGIVGTTTNNNANAGSVGELLTATTASVSLTSSTAANGTSVSLTAGDWEVSGTCQFSPLAGTTITGIVVGISTVSATRPVPFGQENYLLAAFGGNFQTISTPVVRMSLSATTTVYCVVMAIFSGGSGVNAAPTLIRARRVR